MTRVWRVEAAQIKCKTSSISFFSSLLQRSVLSRLPGSHLTLWYHSIDNTLRGMYLDPWQSSRFTDCWLNPSSFQVLADPKLRCNTVRLLAIPCQCVRVLSGICCITPSHLNLFLLLFRMPLESLPTDCHAPTITLLGLLQKEKGA